MLGSIRLGLGEADKLPVGVSSIDLQGYLSHRSGLTRIGAQVELLSRFTRGLSGFASVSAGAYSGNGVSGFEANGLIGLHGIF